MADTGGGAGKNAVLGDILALLAAFFSACYTLIGTRERSHMSTMVYTYVLYWGCFLSLLVFDAVSGVPMTGYEPINWIMSLCLAVFCTLLGHSVFSWSLKFLTPTYVSTVKLAGPVFASVSAIILFGEIPGLIQVAGAAVVLAGVYLYAKIVGGMDHGSVGKSGKKLLGSQIEDSLMEYILNEPVAIGEKLPNEFELAEKFGVGRSTIREAVKSLVSKGVLEVRRGSGTYVVSTSSLEEDPLGLGRFEDKYHLALELFEVRLMLEPEIAALASEYASEEEKAQLESLCDQVERQYTAGINHIKKTLNSIPALQSAAGTGWWRY